MLIDPAYWRILTVRQPWADFLVCDQLMCDAYRAANPELADRLPKDVENRPFGTPFRGLVLIRSAMTVDLDAASLYRLRPDSFVLGKVLGVVKLDGIVLDSASSWAVPGAHHWNVSDPRRFRQPFQIASTHWQGLFKPTAAAVVAAVGRIAALEVGV